MATLMELMATDARDTARGTVRQDLGGGNALVVVAGAVQAVAVLGNGPVRPGQDCLVVASAAGPVAVAGLPGRGGNVLKVVRHA